MNPRVSCLHAADAVRRGYPLTDASLAERLADLVRAIDDTVTTAAVDPNDFWNAAIPVAATIAAATRGVPGRVYNIGGGSRVSINEVLDMIGRVTGRPPVVTSDSAQKGDMRHTYADTSLAKVDLGFAPVVDLERGLSAEYTWLRGTQER